MIVANWFYTGRQDLDLRTLHRMFLAGYLPLHRQDFGVPMHRGLIAHPEYDDGTDNMIDGGPKRTIGSWVSISYEAVRDSSLYN